MFFLLSRSAKLLLGNKLTFRVTVSQPLTNGSVPALMCINIIKEHSSCLLFCKGTELFLILQIFCVNICEEVVDSDSIVFDAQ